VAILTDCKYSLQCTASNWAVINRCAHLRGSWKAGLSKSPGAKVRRGHGSGGAKFRWDKNPEGTSPPARYRLRTSACSIVCECARLVLSQSEKFSEKNSNRFVAQGLLFRNSKWIL
jgi:hypothetical protein